MSGNYFFYKAGYIMQDVIVGSRQGGHGKSKGLVAGIVRTLLLSLILGLLICFDFIMYQRSGTVFLEKEVLHFPFLISCGYLFLGAVCLMVISSFSRWVQSIVFALCFFVLTWGFMNQFLQIDKSQYLTVIIGPYVGPEVASLIDGYSHWIIASILAFVSYLFINRLSFKGMTTLLVVLLIIDGWFLSTAFLLAEPLKQTKEIYTSNEKDISDQGNKLIFLFMPRAASYTALATDTTNDVDKSQLLRRVELGFFIKYGFKLYPNAYVATDNQDTNLIELVNILDNKAYEDHLLNNVGLEGLWKFKSPKKTEIFLKDNQLQDVFKKAKYKITTYQNQRFELCKKNNQYTVDRCINRANLPFDITSSNFSDLDRADILLYQWVSSLDILSNSVVFNILKTVTDRAKMKNLLLPYSQMYVVDSFDVLQRLLDDVAADKKSGVYFVYIDFPGTLNVYDEWCHLKPYKAWSVVSSATKSLYLAEDRKGYNEQMLCFWGQMGELMQKFSKLETANNLTVVLQGLNGLSDSTSNENFAFINRFKNSNQVLTAIRNPQAKFSINSKICRSKDILRHYLFSAQKCKEFNGLNISPNTIEMIKSEFDNYVIKKATMSKAIKAYKEWLTQWKKNRRQIFKINAVAEEPEPVENAGEDDLLTDDAVNALTGTISAETVKEEVKTDSNQPEQSEGKKLEKDNNIVSDENSEQEKKETVAEDEEEVSEPEEDEVSAPEEEENEENESGTEEATSVKEETNQNIQEEKNNKIEDLPLEHTTSVSVENNVAPEQKPEQKKNVSENKAEEVKKNVVPTVKVKVESVAPVKEVVVVSQEKVSAPQKVQDEIPAPKEVPVENKQVIVTQTSGDTVSADFLLEEKEDEWALDPAKALGVSGEETEEIIVKVK